MVKSEGLNLLFKRDEVSRSHEFKGPPEMLCHQDKLIIRSKCEILEAPFSIFNKDTLEKELKPVRMAQDSSTHDKSLCHSSLAYLNVLKKAGNIYRLNWYSPLCSDGEYIYALVAYQKDVKTTIKLVCETFRLEEESNQYTLHLVKAVTLYASQQMDLFLPKVAQHIFMPNTAIATNGS